MLFASNKMVKSPSGSNSHWKCLFHSSSAVFLLAGSFLWQQNLYPQRIIGQGTFMYEKKTVCFAEVWLLITDVQFSNPIHNYNTTITIFLRFGIHVSCNIIFFHTLTAYWYDSFFFALSLSVVGLSCTMTWDKWTFSVFFVKSKKFCNHSMHNKWFSIWPATKQKKTNRTVSENVESEIFFISKQNVSKVSGMGW